MGCGLNFHSQFQPFFTARITYIGEYELLKGSSEPRFKLLILLNVLSEALSQIVELVVQSHPTIVRFDIEEEWPESYAYLFRPG